MAAIFPSEGEIVLAEILKDNTAGHFRLFTDPTTVDADTEWADITFVDETNADAVAPTWGAVTIVSDKAVMTADPITFTADNIVTPIDCYGYAWCDFTTSEEVIYMIEVFSGGPRTFNADDDEIVITPTVRLFDTNS